MVGLGVCRKNTINKSRITYQLNYFAYIGIPVRFSLLPLFSITGQDHQEVGPSSRMLEMPHQEASSYQENQTFRVGRRQKKEGTDDPVLKTILLHPKQKIKSLTIYVYFGAFQKPLKIQAKVLPRKNYQPMP